MDPESLKRLEDATKPENAKSLDDFRRAAGLEPRSLPSVPDEHFDRYKGALEKARDYAGGARGACEDASMSLKLQIKDAQPGMGQIGKPGRGGFDHEWVITKEGYVLDPVAEQAIDKGVWTADQLRDHGLESAVKRGIFSKAQWTKFAAGPP
jgi:hypothetical protein